MSWPKPEDCLKTYEIGYRTTGIGGSTEPYTDLPGVFFGYVAIPMYNRLKRDFPQAEWRLVESRNCQCWCAHCASVDRGYRYPRVREQGDPNA